MLRPLLAGLLCALALGAAAAEPHGIAVIMAPGADVQVDRQELALIFKRRKRFWPDGTRAAPVNLPASHPLRRAFSRAVLGSTPEQLDDYWRDQYFHGELPPYVAGSEEAAIRFVAATPGAIGYVSECLRDPRVKVVLLLEDGPPCGR